MVKVRCLLHYQVALLRLKLHLILEIGKLLQVCVDIQDTANDGGNLLELLGIPRRKFRNLSELVERH